MTTFLFKSVCNNASLFHFISHFTFSHFISRVEIIFLVLDYLQLKEGKNGHRSTVEIFWFDIIQDQWCKIQDQWCNRHMLVSIQLLRVPKLLRSEKTHERFLRQFLCLSGSPDGAQISLNSQSPALVPP